MKLENNKELCKFIWENEGLTIEDIVDTVEKLFDEGLLVLEEVDGEERYFAAARLSKALAIEDDLEEEDE